MCNQFEDIWGKFLTHLEDEISRSSQADVARRLGVNRGQVSKWLSGLQVGGNLKTFITHVNRLGLNWDELTPLHSAPVNSFDKSLTHVLLDVMKALGKDQKAILDNKAVSDISPSLLDALFQGKGSFSAYTLYKICKAIGVSPGTVMDRASQLIEATEQRKGDDIDRRSA